MMKRLEKNIASSVTASIEKIIRHELSNLTITKIEIKEATDFDGDTVFHVTVVFDSENGSPDPKKMAGLVRHVRSGIENKTERFPIFRFISQPDARRIGIATA